MIAAVYGGDWIHAHLNLNAVSALELSSMFSIKGYRCRAAGILGNITPQYNVIGKYHATKAQHMRTNWCHENTRDGRMDHRSASCHAVSGRTCWTVGMTRGNQLEQIHQTHILDNPNERMTLATCTQTYVAKMIPSACTVVRWTSSQKHSRLARYELLPRSMTTSFKTL